MITSINNSRHFEEIVCYILQNNCSESEHMELEYKAGNGIILDAYTKTGIKSLNIQNNTLIEVKYILTPDSIAETLSIMKRIAPLVKVDKCLLIYGTHNTYSAYFKTHLPNKIQIKSIEEIDSNWQQNAIQEALNPQKKIYEEAQRIFTVGQCAFILGAGVSQNAGLPSWDKLLKDLAKELHRDDLLKKWNKEFKMCFNSSIIFAQYIINDILEKDDEIQNNEKERLNDKNISLTVQKILQSYPIKKRKSLLKAIVKHIGEGHVDEVLTFNYDDLLETELSKMYEGFSVNPIYGNNRKEEKYFPIYHLHGFTPLNDKERPIYSTAIITEEQYHQLYKLPYHWSNITLLHSLNTKTCFFIGLSMSDPNLRRLLDYYTSENYATVIEDNYKSTKYRHYIFMKYDTSFKNSVDKTEHMRRAENRFQRWGIDVIWFNRYRELPQLIKDLYNKEIINKQ